MATWFKRTKKGNITKTTYLDGRKPTTWSQSSGTSTYRYTLTHRGSKIEQTITRKNGGYVNIQKRTLNKKVKPNLPNLKKLNNRFKKKAAKVKYYKKRRSRSRNINYKMSFKSLFFIILFSFICVIISAL